MQDIQTLVQSDDVSELRFYLDYYLMIIEMMEKREKDTSELVEELRQLERRIEALEGPSDL
jgi:hypothetical protein